MESEALRINAVFVVKDEWPLLALSLTHALINFAHKVIIIDTGSKDGTFSGVRTLQELFPNRIELFRCQQTLFDQAPLSNIGLFLSEIDGADWTIILDADEFLYTPDASQFMKLLASTPDPYIGFALPVVNYAPFKGFDGLELSNFANIKARVKTQSAFHLPDLEFIRLVSQGSMLLQQRSTPNKVLLKNSKESFVSQGNHQLVFGDGIHWVRWDSRVASSTEFNWQILHLPYTDYSRFKQRLSRSFHDGETTTYRLSAFKGKIDVPIEKLFEKALVSAGNESLLEENPNYVLDDTLSLTLASTISTLENLWPTLKTSEYSESVANSYKSELNFEIVSKLVRKFFDKSYSQWNSLRTQ